MGPLLIHLASKRPVLSWLPVAQTYVCFHAGVCTLSLCVCIYICMFWEVCVRLESASKWRAASFLQVASVVLSTLAEVYFS